MTARRFRWGLGVVAAIAWITGGCDGATEKAAPSAEVVDATAALDIPMRGGHMHEESPPDASVADAAGTNDVGAPTAQPVVCELGTMYPTWPPIDPDNPDFEDDVFSKEQVIETFATDKAKNGDAYRAYKAALVHQDVLDCAFCSCGCTPSIGHLSAIDCFKDMHGFG